MIEHNRLFNAGAYLLLILGLVFALGPLYMAVCSATVSNPQLFAHGLAVIPGDQLLENLQQVTRRLDLLRLLGNSLLVATLVVIGKLTLSALTAFAVVYFRSRYSSVIFFAVLGALLLPLEVRIIPTYSVASDLLAPVRSLLHWLGIQWLPLPTINLLDSYPGLALPLIASATGTFLFRQFYQTLPAELVEAARMDGAGPWRFFIDILLPLSKTNFAALGTLVFIGAWKDYLWPLVATNREDMRTLVLGVASFLPTDATQVPEWNLLMAAAVVSMLPPILVIALMQRWFVKGLIESVNERAHPYYLRAGYCPQRPAQNLWRRTHPSRARSGFQGGRTQRHPRSVRVWQVHVAAHGGRAGRGKPRADSNGRPRRYAPAAHERGCAMVFQNYALYPHMSVADNIGYALKLARVARKEREQRIRECAASLGLEDLLQRKPGELSGGQRQRVAIGRALIRKPPVLLFDEPLCNLDSALRHEMRLLIRSLHRQTGATILYVTHDQTEAMTLAERVVILDKGRVEQIGTPAEIYDQPASTFVASFIGTPPMNLLPVHCLDDRILLLADGQRLPIKLGIASNRTGKWLMGLRPETFMLDPKA